MDDIRDIELKIVKNLHRKVLDVDTRDTFIYNTWKQGLKANKFKNIREFAEIIGISEDRLRRIISVEEENEKI